MMNTTDPLARADRRRNGTWRRHNKARSKGGLTARLPLRCRTDQPPRWAEAAATQGLPVADWARLVLDEAAAARLRAVYGPSMQPPPATKGLSSGAVRATR